MIRGRYAKYYLEQQRHSDLVRYLQPKTPLNLGPYWILAAIRVLITLLPQNGYIHPDEYFQSIEVIAGDIFEIDVSRPWEFNVTYPVRSIVLPFLTVGLPYTMLQSVAPFINLWFDVNIKTPYVILVLPRLVSCALSFICDYSLYRICLAYGQNVKTRLIIFASSYVVLVYGTRTFSNTTEMVLLSLLLYLVAHCMKLSDQVICQDEVLTQKFRTATTPVERVKFFKLRSALPSHSLSHCLAVSSITVAGIFNRPTFIAFAFPPIFFWLHRGLGSKSVGFSQFHARIITFAACGLPMLLLFVFIDSLYYGYLTMDDVVLLRVNLEHFVITPVNFLRYNSNVQNLAKHGLHPMFLHFLVNLPLLYNVLAIIGLYTVGKMIITCTQGKFRDLPRVQSIVGLMTGSFVVPVAALSIFPHQEPRFIIPVTLPLIFLHAQKIQNIPNIEPTTKNNNANESPRKSYRDVLLSLWCIFNLILTLFYGFLHQGGIYYLAKNLALELQEKPRLTALHLVTNHIYPLPLSLLHLRSTRYSLFDKQTGKRFKLAKELYTYELGGASLDEVKIKLESVLKSCEEKWVSKKLDYRLYLALPTSLTKQFENVAHYANFTYSVEKVFYPHLSTEALPTFGDHALCSPEDGRVFDICIKDDFYYSPLKFSSKFFQQLGLALISIRKLEHNLGQN